MPLESPGSHGFGRLALYRLMQGNPASAPRMETAETHSPDPYKQ